MKVSERDRNGATIEFTSRESIVLNSLAAGLTRACEDIKFKLGWVVRQDMAESFRDTVEDRGYGEGGKKFRFNELDIHTLCTVAEIALEHFDTMELENIENLSRSEIEWFAEVIRSQNLIPGKTPFSAAPYIVN